jgi:selenocysteine lyase/cysteine desulfurase
LFDTIAALPGYRMPFEALTKICKDEGILSLIDGAHGVGHVKIDLEALDPDFFVSNCHKWLFVPRGCAVFYVPLRNQPLIRSTLPTSHGFVPVHDPDPDRVSPLPVSMKSEFVHNFEFVGTLDSNPYLCVPEAIKFREEVCGGEDSIMSYCIQLAKDGGRKVAEILGTEVLDCPESTMTDCCLINVRLPLRVGPKSAAEAGIHMIEPGYGIDATSWMEKTLMEEFDTFLAMIYFQDVWWIRLSAQVYLDLEDFEWCGLKLKEICERAGKGEYLENGNRKVELQTGGVATFPQGLVG